MTAEASLVKDAQGPLSPASLVGFCSQHLRRYRRRRGNTEQ